MADLPRTPRSDPAYYGTGPDVGHTAPMGRFWRSRISWSAIIAGVLVAIAAQITLSALGTWIGFGLADVTDIEALADVSGGVGIWIAISALIALFLGGFVASWIAGSRSIMNGLWHGLVVWATAMVFSVWLSFQGIAGILGFSITPAGTIDFLPEVEAAPAAQTVADVTADFAGWFVLAAVVSLVVALVGGWLGTLNRGRGAVETFREEDVTGEQYRAA